MDKNISFLKYTKNEQKSGMVGEITVKLSSSIRFELYNIWIFFQQSSVAKLQKCIICKESNMSKVLVSVL